MKTMLLAAAAALCLGVGAARADQGEDSGAIDPNSYFTELPGEVSTAPGARPNDAAANAWQLTGQPTSTTQAAPSSGTNRTTLN
jgi:hypothetical protein